METNDTKDTGDPTNIAVTEAALKNSFAAYGNEITEIISKRPSLIIRWGTFIFFLFLVVICIICWFIQYPDIVTAKARLNSVNASKEVITRTEGKIAKILAKENEQVQAEQVLGYMESIANPQAVAIVAGQIDSIIYLISQNRTDEITRYFPNNASFGIGSEAADLGELQAPYQTYIQSFIAFKYFLSTGFYLRKKGMLATDMQNMARLHRILTTQKGLMQKDLTLTQQTHDANATLHTDKVIADFEMRSEESKLIAKQLSLPQINSSLVGNESQQNEKRKEIAELENQIIVQKNTFIQALQTFKSQVQAWEYKYLLKAPVAGTVSFAGFLQENQEIKAGHPLFYVQPGNTSYFVEMLIPQYNFGKVKMGQQVLLKFQAYPSEQYGSVSGTIDLISNSPADSGFLAKVSLPNGLVTNYKKPLQYRYGLFAQADIITENMRLLERFYYNLAKQFKK